MSNRNNIQSKHFYITLRSISKSHAEKDNHTAENEHKNNADILFLPYAIHRFCGGNMC